MNRLIKLLIVSATVLLSLWLGGQALPFFAPFLLSFSAAFLMEPAVSALSRRGVPRGLSAGIMTAMTLLLCGGIIGGCAVGGVQMLTSYARQAPALLTALTENADRVKQQMYIIISKAPQPVAQELLSAAEGVSAQLSEFPMWLSQKALDGVTVFARQSPDWVLFLCTAIIGIYFFSAYFQDISSFFRRQLSDATLHKLQLIRSVTTGAAWGYLKVQCIISGITFLILLAAFHLMGLEDKLTAAVGIAVIDALPILGSGAVLIPWALAAMLLGNFPRALALILIYGVLLVVHNMMQAKLMGNHLGLHPVAALVSLYVGWKLGGILGMILLPVVCVLLCSLNDAGIIRLYQ